MLFVAADSPLQSFADFIAAARAAPGGLRVATSGFGTHRRPDAGPARRGRLPDDAMRRSPIPHDRYEAALDAPDRRRCSRSRATWPRYCAAGRLRPLVAFADAAPPGVSQVPSAREFGLRSTTCRTSAAWRSSASVAPDKVGRAGAGAEAGRWPATNGSAIAAAPTAARPRTVRARPSTACRRWSTVSRRYGSGCRAERRMRTAAMRHPAARCGRLRAVRGTRAQPVTGAGEQFIPIFTGREIPGPAAQRHACRA